VGIRFQDAHVSSLNDYGETRTRESVLQLSKERSGEYHIAECVKPKKNDGLWSGLRVAGSSWS
jgi:hypothetical protein